VNQLKVTNHRTAHISFRQLLLPLFEWLHGNLSIKMNGRQQRVSCHISFRVIYTAFDSEYCKTGHIRVRAGDYREFQNLTIFALVTMVTVCDVVSPLRVSLWIIT
jgi:hypothetical protein